jgi:hypothetical protein
MERGLSYNSRDCIQDTNIRSNNCHSKYYCHESYQIQGSRFYKKSHVYPVNHTIWFGYYKLYSFSPVQEIYLEINTMLPYFFITNLYYLSHKESNHIFSNVCLFFGIYNPTTVKEFDFSDSSLSCFQQNISLAFCCISRIFHIVFIPNWH